MACRTALADMPSGRRLSTSRKAHDRGQCSTCSTGPTARSDTVIDEAVVHARWWNRCQNRANRLKRHGSSQRASLRVSRVLRGEQSARADGM